MKGIILAGGKGTRLHPITMGVSKQLLPVYDCPMIYYPLSVLLKASISEILIISSSEDIYGFERLFGNGAALGCSISYKIQVNPNGIAEALILAETFLEGQGCTLILGDNIFSSDTLSEAIKFAIKSASSRATIFSFPVRDPNRYGVLSFDSAGVAVDIIEKPDVAPSNRVVTGLYVYPFSAVQIAKLLQPSHRGEIEITDINRHFLRENSLDVVSLQKSDAWFDTGTIDSLYQATEYVRALEARSGVKLGCVEQAAFEGGLLTIEQIKRTAAGFSNSSYGQYLNELIHAHGV